MPSAAIMYVRSDRNYTWFFANDGRSVLTSKTLARFAPSLLAHSYFVRLSRGQIVNLMFVIDYQETQVLLANGQKLTVSRRCGKGLRAKLEQLKK